MWLVVTLTASLTVQKGVILDEAPLVRHTVMLELRTETVVRWPHVREDDRLRVDALRDGWKQGGGTSAGHNKGHSPVRLRLLFWTKNITLKTFHIRVELEMDCPMVRHPGCLLLDLLDLLDFWLDIWDLRNPIDVLKGVLLVIVTEDNHSRVCVELDPTINILLVAGGILTQSGLRLLQASFVAWAFP